MTSPTTIRRGWLHETHPDLEYRWLVPDRLMRHDESGIEITFRPSRLGDVICGARTIEPGIPGLCICGEDLSAPHEVVCTVVGDHGEAPHIGASPFCEDVATPGGCSKFGGYHMVIVGFAIRPDRPSVAPGVTADQDVWGPDESEEP